MSFILVETETEIAKVTLDHPTGNRINFAMREELLQAFRRVADSKARVLVVRGKGTDFSLGGDVRDWAGKSAAELTPRIGVFAKAIEVLEQLKIPTIAAVQGACMGGGFELALGCDLIVAARSARFAFPEARVGIVTLQGGVFQVAERIGRSKAIEMAFLSEPVAAEQMAVWNVVNHVVEDAALEAEAETLAQRLAAGPPGAYAVTKALLSLWKQEGQTAASAALYDLSMPLFDTHDVQTAMKSAAVAIDAGLPLPKANFTGA
jgi:enoyl-CoA hydratase/carnithine racemase